VNNEPNQSDVDDFAAFEAAGEVEVGDSNLVEQPEEKPTKKAPKAKEKPAPDPVEDEVDEDGDDSGEESDDSGEEDGDDGDKPKKSAKDFQIERLKREKAELARQLREGTNRELLERLERIEKGLQPENSGGNRETEISPEPDPNDLDKYPLGHLDPGYIEDKLDWLTETKAAKQADAVLQRQQEVEQQHQLLEKVDNLATRGSELFEDFQETVVEAGMRGDWDLSQTTFEAAHEAENGVQILYDLAQNPKEASRVAKLSPFQQIKYVAERDAEISKSKSPRRIPKAGDPPQNPARGANSRTQINPATDNLDDFEKAWEADARKSNR
jgi:hypothetical protein